MVYVSFSDLNSAIDCLRWLPLSAFVERTRAQHKLAHPYMMSHACMSSREHHEHLLLAYQTVILSFPGSHCDCQSRCMT